MVTVGMIAPFLIIRELVTSAPQVHDYMGFIMIFIFLACSQPAVSISGLVPAAGDSTVFLARCTNGDPEALLLKEATQQQSCEEAWVRLSTIDAIDISHADISDLTVLSGMTNLKKISAYENNISDLSPIVTLDRVEELYLVSNKISDISPLLALRQLTVLRLDGNLVQNIDILPKLKRLNRLGLDKNQIRDFRPISKLDDIQSLNTNFNPVDIDKCPIEGPGPKQLYKYCKRMHKHQKKLEEN
jgi:Leucine-rich repeat (LRR) protein